MKSLQAGITRRASMTALLGGAATAALGGRAAFGFVWPPAPPDITVAQDGSGQFTSIHAALQSIPRDNIERKTVFVRNGIYKEQVRVDAPYVSLIGQTATGYGSNSTPWTTRRARPGRKDGRASATRC